MRYKRTLLMVLFTVCFLIMGTIEVSAESNKLSTVPISEERAEEILEYIDLVFLTEEPGKCGIASFDVNEKGMVAIGLDNMSVSNIICIYDSDGTFLYGYNFKTQGAYDVEWDGDILNIYTVRSYNAIAVNSEGEVQNVFDIKESVANDTYWRKVIDAKKKEAGGNTYALKSGIGILGIFSPALLTVTDATGEQRVVYDARLNQAFISMCFVVFALMIVGGITTWAIRDIVGTYNVTWGPKVYSRNHAFETERDE